MKTYWKKVIREDLQVNFLKDILELKETKLALEISKLGEIVISYSNKAGEVNTMYIPFKDLKEYL